jgi:hypothetical protein
MIPGIEKENCDACHVIAIDVGPGLAAVLAAQRLDEEAVDYPAIGGYAGALARLCSTIDDPCVWPVGAAAERLAGAALVFGCGRMRVRGWSSDLAGQRVLLVTVAATTPLPLFVAAEQALSLGAREVLACGVHVQGIEHSRLAPWVAYFELTSEVFRGDAAHGCVRAVEADADSLAR